VAFGSPRAAVFIADAAPAGGLLAMSRAESANTFSLQRYPSELPFPALSDGAAGGAPPPAGDGEEMEEEEEEEEGGDTVRNSAVLAGWDAATGAATLVPSSALARRLRSEGKAARLSLSAAGAGASPAAKRARRASTGGKCAGGRTAEMDAVAAAEAAAREAEAEAEEAVCEGAARGGGGSICGAPGSARSGASPYADALSSMEAMEAEGGAGAGAPSPICNFGASRASVGSVAAGAACASAAGVGGWKRQRGAPAPTEPASAATAASGASAGDNTAASADMEALFTALGGGARAAPARGAAAPTQAPAPPPPQPTLPPAVLPVVGAVRPEERGLCGGDITAVLTGVRAPPAAGDITMCLGLGAGAAAAGALPFPAPPPASGAPAAAAPPPLFPAGWAAAEGEDDSALGDFSFAPSPAREDASRDTTAALPHSLGALLAGEALRGAAPPAAALVAGAIAGAVAASAGGMLRCALASAAAPQAPPPAPPPAAAQLAAPLTASALAAVAGLPLPRPLAPPAAAGGPLASPHRRAPPQPSARTPGLNSSSMSLLARRMSVRGFFARRSPTHPFPREFFTNAPTAP
jgi:hypothetical protein